MAFTRKGWIKMSAPPSIAAVCLALAVTCSVTTAAENAKSNFLFIIADDCTYRDLGCYGGQAHTPNIDRLATQGMRFTQCFQAAPMCSPTRHNIYTGLYPVKSGAYPNHTFAKDGTKSVVHYLKPLGYRVALSGKRHIAPAKVFPFEYSGKKNPDFKAIAVEPTASPVISGGSPAPHKIQGIGAGFIPNNLDQSLLNGVEQVTNEDAFAWARRMAEEEGIYVGISSGANACAAARVAAKPENKGKRIVTIAASFGERYISTPLFEDSVG